MSLLTQSIKETVRFLATRKVVFDITQPDSNIRVVQVGVRVVQIIDGETGETSYHSIGECFQ